MWTFRCLLALDGFGYMVLLLGLYVYTGVRCFCGFGFKGGFGFRLGMWVVWIVFV